MSEPKSNTKFCFECGEKIKSNVSFCPECGAKHDQENEMNAVNPVENESSSELDIDSSNPTTTWLGYSLPPALTYHLTWGGVVFILIALAAGWPRGTAYFGMFLSALGVWVDGKYATQLSEHWEPNMRAYLAGTILLQGITVPLYLYRRRKYV